MRETRDDALPVPIEADEELDDDEIHLPEAFGPSGRTTTVRAVRDLARKYTTRAVRVIANLMEHGRDERVRLSAAEAILDRAWGRPSQEVKLTEDVDPAETSRRRERIAQLSSDPEYLTKVAVLLQVSRVLPSNEAPAFSRPTEIIVEPVIETEYQKLERAAEPASQEAEPEVVKCEAQGCQHEAASHPGGGGCEARGCRCPLLIVPMGGMQDSSEDDGLHS